MKSTAAWVLAIAICIALSHTSLADDDDVVVQTATTTYHGKRVDVNPYQLPDFHGRVAAYTRIPYAEPPISELRFRRPVPHVIDGDFDATRGPIACSQMIMPAFDLGMETSEDCLYLDVYVPEPKPSSAAVMVWIHGGGFQAGAGSIPSMLPIPLAAINDVIVVTFNYRLNIFGFLSTGDEEIPANLALLDQRQVLIWVQENIAAFGGDPNRVTIFGESAGSASVNFQLLSPMSAGLFSGAIMQSGTASVNGFFTAERGTEIAFALGSILNCSATTTKELTECLRGKTEEELVYVTEDPMEMALIAARPTIDGEFLPKSPLELTAEGAVNPAKILIGCNADEGNLFIMPTMTGSNGTSKPVVDEATFQGFVGVIAETADPLVTGMASFAYAPQEELAKAEPDFADATADFMGDYMFLCSSFDCASHYASADLSVFLYVMTHTPSQSIWGKDMTWLGATHGEDIPYVFGTPFGFDSEDDIAESHAMTGYFNEEEVEMSLQIMKYWSNFAKTGNPNLASKDGDPESKYPSWPAYSKEQPLYKTLSKTFENLDSHPQPKRCKFQLKLLPKLVENAAEMARLKSLLEDKVSADSERSCDDPESCPEE